MNPTELAELHALAFSATRAWSAAEFANLLEHKGTFVVGDTRSFVLVRTVADEAEVLTLATHPKHRRKGLARRELQAAEQTATSYGATSMFLEVAEDNKPAISLYNGAHYQQVGRRPGYYLPKDGAPIAAFVLRKELAAT